MGLSRKPCVYITGLRPVIDFKILQQKEILKPKSKSLSKEKNKKTPKIYRDPPHGGRYDKSTSTPHRAQFLTLSLLISPARCLPLTRLTTAR